MENFNFIVDYQCSLWCRNNLTIQAESKEEALTKLMELIRIDPQFRNDYVGIENEWEYLPESEYIMEHDYAEDPATIEVYEGGTTEDCMIWNNQEGEVKPKPQKTPQELKEEQVLVLLSKAVSGTEKDYDKRARKPVPSGMG